jgi:hypothetical protein
MVPGTERTPESTSQLPAAPRELPHATDVWVSLSIALVLAMIAAIIALWPNGQGPDTPSQSLLPTLTTKDSLPHPSPQPEDSGAQSSPVRFTNPFDASEVVEFPPGTTEEAARASVAEMLLQRARERRAHLATAKHVREHRSAALRASTLMPEHF